MKFQVESIVVDDVVVPLSNMAHGGENVYTMLVGRNASGKTKVLSKLANNYIFEKNLLASAGYCTVGYGSQSKPSRVIAVSNSRFDRFPNPDLFRMRRQNNGSDYHYLGLAGFRSSPHSILAKACVPVIEDLALGGGKSDILARLLDYIGFLPALHVELRRPYLSGSNARWDIDSIYDGFVRGDFPRNKNSGREFDFDKDILPGLIYFSNQDAAGRNLSLHIDLVSGWRGYSDLHEVLKYAPSLIESGVLNLSRFNLFDKRTKNKFPLSLASSGQQCMLLMFIGLAGLVKDGSLICIDEPEISLHPKWQAEFIGILQDAFSIYKGCHFVIATHSPQVVSGLTSKNGFVVDLEDLEILVSNDYAKKSADFQLTHVFHEPGFKNEYLLRTLLVILSKLTKNERLSRDDFDKLSRVDKVRDRLEATDPVVHLLQQVKMLAGVE